MRGHNSSGLRIDDMTVEAKDEFHSDDAALVALAWESCGTHEKAVKGRSRLSSQRRLLNSGERGCHDHAQFLCVRA